MPVRISTPDQWFRVRKCEFYEFRVVEGQRELPTDAKEWELTNPSCRSFVTLGPSEHSGRISGSPAMEVIEINLTEAERFRARWEIAAGKSPDPRWQCFQWRYEDLLGQFEHVEVFEGMPSKGMPFRWLLCDAGTYWIKGHYAESSIEDKNFCGIPTKDDWWWICREFSEVKLSTISPFMMGCVYVTYSGACNVAFQMNQRKGKDVSHTYQWPDGKGLGQIKDTVREALALPTDTEIHYGFD